MVTSAKAEIIYPESDGAPLGEGTEQFDWIVYVKLGVEAVLKDITEAFVAGDLFWYPVEHRPDIVYAPDTMVAFGRPKGARGSYLQWKEGNIAPQVVFEIWSPSNTKAEMKRKRDFYERYGVEEYYEYDPKKPKLEGWLRQPNGMFQLISNMNGWISPRLGIRFELDPRVDKDMRIYNPDGTSFLDFVELTEQKKLLEQQLEQERHRTEFERQRVEQERQRAERLIAQLRALGIEPEA